MLLLPLYFQEVRGTDALGAGLLLVPQGIGTLFSRTLAGRLTDTLGARIVTIAASRSSVSRRCRSRSRRRPPASGCSMAALLVRGFGLGAVTIPLMAVAFVGLDRAEVPHASILTRIAQQIGGSFGVAVLAVILQTAAVGAHTLDGIADAFDTAFWWAVGFTVVAVGLSFLLPGRPKAVRSAARNRARRWRCGGCGAGGSAALRRRTNGLTSRDRTIMRRKNETICFGASSLKIRSRPSADAAADFAPRTNIVFS